MIADITKCIMSLRFLIVILLEGYIVLSTEIIVIRQLVPFVGNGIPTTATVIAAFLLPIALGCYFGGNYKIAGKRITISDKVVNNFIIAALVMFLGLSYYMQTLFFFIVGRIGLTNAIAQVAFFCSIFIVYPIFLLGQTVPLLSNYFGHMNVQRVAGYTLFCSTLGSFFGSILSSVVLMDSVGVHNTVTINFVFMAIVVFILAQVVWYKVSMVFIVVALYFINSTASLKDFNIVANNKYNLISISTFEDGGKLLQLNHSASSYYGTDDSKMFAYFRYIKENFLRHAQGSEEKKDILVLGAGGFTIGVDDFHNNYTYVDVDQSLQEIAETQLLGKPIGENKKFIVKAARTFLLQGSKKYDLIISDVSSNYHTIPFQLITKEYFEGLLRMVQDDGIIVLNILTSPNFVTAYSINVDNTIREVFGNVNRQVLCDYNAWQDKNATTCNVLYVFFNNGNALHKVGKKSVYTDNKNRYYGDQ